MRHLLGRRAAYSGTAREELDAPTCEVLASRRAPAQDPLRAELLGGERFRLHGAALGRCHYAAMDVRAPWRRQQTFEPRLNDNLRELTRAKRYLEWLDTAGENLTPAGEWLLDNHHLIVAQAHEVRQELPWRRLRRLPQLCAAPLTGMPRVYGLAWTFVVHTDSNFDTQLLGTFLKAYQDTQTLTLGELWAIPICLRAVLLENLARLAYRLTRCRAVQRAADWCSHHATQMTPTGLQRFYDDLSDDDLKLLFCAQLSEGLRQHASSDVAWMSLWLEQQATHLSNRQMGITAQQLQAADNVSVTNAVSALHAINKLDWLGLIEDLSPVLQRLGQSPAFRTESVFSRDQCTHEVERLAQVGVLTEIEVVEQVMALEAEAGAPDFSGPSYWLLGDGRAILHARLGVHPVAARRWALRLLSHLKGPLFAAGVVFGAGWLAMRAMGSASMEWTVTGVWSWIALPFVFLLASECLLALGQRVLAESLSVRRLPRLALEDGLQAAHRTLVVVPCMLVSEEGVRALAHQLERHHLASRERFTRFALLSDWCDAQEAQTELDGALLRCAQAAIDELNRRYPVDGGEDPRFALFHRARVWCESEGVWMGWERKRGKIDALIHALASNEQGTACPFLDLGPISRISSGVQYLLTLDADTVLPPRALRELVAVAAHPLNQPRHDPRTGRVVKGYGLFQPHVAAPIPDTGAMSAFGWMFGGPWGLDGYNNGSSEVYQDLFGQGSYFGKGLFNVAAADRALRGRTPENQLLSHDLYEGFWVRTAHLSDVQVLESTPMHTDVAASRAHRWTRGDWQLLALWRYALQGRVGGLNLWKMADNLRRSLLAPTALVVLWMGTAAGALPAENAWTLVLAALGMGPVVGALAAWVPHRPRIAWMHFVRSGAADLVRATLAVLWQVATLPGLALRQLDAIGRALWRSMISRRRLLEWTTAAQAQANARLDLWHFVRQGAPAASAGAALTAVGGLLPHADTDSLWTIGLIWAALPLWNWAVSQPIEWGAEEATLPPQVQGEMLALARETWSYFVACVTASDHHLPPDNLQLAPYPMLARRTSPTNVGFYLASCACAHRLGFIDLAELRARLEATLGTLENLPRWHGHFHNWTDTEQRRPLHPMYISTVDSGNLVACLWLVAQACRSWSQQTEATLPQTAQALVSLAERLERLANATDFAPLYDSKRHLLHIGFNLEDGRLDPAHYDLLASESRLTSLVAIAKGDVPPSHWRALGRPFLAVHGNPVLMSWSGSMFEYFLPTLLLREPRGGLLQKVTHAALHTHRLWGAALGLPWGVSECAYFLQDRQGAFQYGPFGVPLLAMRRTPLEDRVVAPYATLLALQVHTRAAIENIHTLERLGARDRHGLIEALDFSPQRLGHTGAYRRVLSYMAHHQGMGMVSLCNLLCQGAVREWMSSHPCIAAHDSLLQEPMPREVVCHAQAIPRPAHRVPTEEALGARCGIRPSHMAPADMPTLPLGNGRYGVCVRPNGAGQAWWNGVSIHRSRDDVLRDGYGHWLLLRTGDQFDFNSLTLAPCPHPEGEYVTHFHEDHVEFECSTPAWFSRVRQWVSPEDDVELRQIELHNRQHRPISVELWSLFEATLASEAADEAHTAFSNLFVQAHAADPTCLVLHRSARGDDEPDRWVAHFLSCAPSSLDLRQVILGGSRAGMFAHRPAPEAPLTSTGQSNQQKVPTWLDPAASLRVPLRIAGHERMSLVLATAAASDLPSLMALVDAYRQSVHVNRSQLQSVTLTRLRCQALGMGAHDLHAVQDLATRMVMALGNPQQMPDNSLDRRALWRLSISGDRPIVLVSIESAQGLGLVRQLCAAQCLWSLAGLHCDLVVLDSEVHSYRMPLQQQLTQLCDEMTQSAGIRPVHGSMRVLRRADVSPSEWTALRCHANFECRADGRTLTQVLATSAGTRYPTRTATPPGRPRGGNDSVRIPSAYGRFPPRPLAHASGRFIDGGQTFELHVDGGHATPRPWSNVMSNPGFGCIVTESGGGHTWAGNSRMNPLTPIGNDALLDPTGEHFWIQDTGSGEVFDLTGGSDRNGPSGVTVTHRPGMSVFKQTRGRLAIETAIYVHPQASAKCVRIRLQNQGAQTVSLRLLAMVEWIMGPQRRARMTVQTTFWRAAQALLATQHQSEWGAGQGTGFLLLAGWPIWEWTGDRREFFDTLGRLQVPDTMAGRFGFGQDPCAGLGSVLILDSDARHEICWVLGYGKDVAAAKALALELRQPGALDAAADQAVAQWRTLASAVQVHSPDAAWDALVNHWLPYQVVSARLWARAGYYQTSGATGFRDQLQDAMALAWARPDLLREQILKHAKRQFIEGDVQHWWHEPTGAGIRTRFSDDLLWLPLAIAHYLQITEDASVLDERVRFLSAPPLPEGVSDVYGTPADSMQSAPLYEHAVRAIERSLQIGAHGLPLMGTGDWNDAMNRVGQAGRGESVWLAEFLMVVLRDWSELASKRGDSERSARWHTVMVALEQAITGAGWDGAWFRRAYFDDGWMLGTSASTECRIDLIAQCWAVFALGANHPLARQAMRSADHALVDRPLGLIRLLDPALRPSDDRVGYIQAYPPGVRENGGHYSQAVVWALIAQAQLGDAERAWEYLHMLSPAHRTNDEASQRLYGLEPYVMAGDICSEGELAGRGGWSWYTGSAAWLYRASIENLLGIQVQAGRLRLVPCLPAAWPGLEISLRLGDRTICISVRRRMAPHANRSEQTPQQQSAATSDTLELEAGQWITLRELPQCSRLVLMLEMVVGTGASPASGQAAA